MSTQPATTTADKHPQPGETWEAWVARFRLMQAKRYLRWASEALENAGTAIDYAETKLAEN